MVIIYQFLISKLNKLYFFLILFISLCSVLLFDSLVFNFILKYDTPIFTDSLIGHIIGKSFSAFIFSFILYIYLKFIDKEEDNGGFIAAQNREVFSILNYREKYFNLKEEKQHVEKKYISQIESTLNQISDGFVSLDTNWCYTYINEKAAEFLGKSPESLIGKHIWKEFPEGIGSSIDIAYRKAQKTIHFENYFEPLDKWFKSRIYPSPEGLTIYYTDITEKKKAETHNQMLLSLIETSDDFLGLATLEGKPTYLNTNGRQLVGLKSNEELADSITDFFPQNYKEVILNEHMPNIYKKDKWNGEVEFKNFKTGALIPIEMSGFLIKDNLTKKSIALGIVAKDITQCKKSEEKLISSEQLFRGLSSNVPVAIFQADKDGACNYVNEEWLKYSGQSFNEVMGFGWSNAIHPEDKERVVSQWQESIVTGTNLFQISDCFKKTEK
ncbi:PAS domain-containing protein [Maribacter forsetii]|uniref:PAS domain-containing protein n=1 Tax=Maribacter forsetii TaxID=444515 RepID=UPI000565822E|nr:PAS domain S-box protein [Maribacter forsetii]